ncbi:MAG TPA: hypothetical protein VGQ80_15275, partial [Acidimicrobiia bacterium]|nr:hypothetical protein [Acidimicrobiia bacterium]
IARSSDDVARTALVRLSGGGIDALGESSPITRYGESIASVTAGLAGHPLGDDPYAVGDPFPDDAFPDDPFPDDLFPQDPFPDGGDGRGGNVHGGDGDGRDGGPRG